MAASAPPARPTARSGARWAALAVLGACRGAAPDGGGTPVEPGRAAEAARVHPANAGTFAALQGALEDGEDELTRQILATLRACELSAREQELVDSAERVLTGRALVRAFELALVSEPLPDSLGGFRLLLRARSSASLPLVLRLPPADLRRARGAIDAAGFEAREFESRTTSALGALELRPGEERTLELLSYELPLGRALAVRERWRLVPRSGEIDAGGESYPAARVLVAGCERERLSPLLAAGPAEPAAAASELLSSDPAWPRVFLETCLRIDPARRTETLLALAAVVAELAQSEPARVEAAEPGLRWLSGNRELGRDARAWARYLGSLDERSEPLDPAPNLDLP